MGVDQTIVMTFLLIGLAVAAQFFLWIWQMLLHQDSVYKGVRGPIDLLFRFISNTGNTKPVRHLDETRELRPTIGYRLGLPVVIIALFAYITLVVMADSGGMNVVPMPPGIFVLVGAFVLYWWIWIQFFHVVKYDAQKISVVNSLFQTKEKDIADLIDVTSLPRRQLYQLKFVDGSKLHVAWFISDRAAFLRDMKTAVAHNQAHGRGKRVFFSGMRAYFAGA